MYRGKEGFDKTNSRVYSSPGFCIYCHRREPDVALRPEHIMPLGFGGGFVLLKSSCDACGTITGRFEQRTMRFSFGTIRRQLNMRSGRRKISHDPVRLEIHNADGTITEQLISVSDYANVLWMPRLLSPGLMAGTQNTPLVAEFLGSVETQTAHKLKPFIEKKQVINHRFDVLAFAQMLAKIGYSLAVAELGLENFEPCCVDFILGRSPQRAGDIVGQSELIYPNGLKPHTRPHRIGLQIYPLDGGHFVFGTVHLFCTKQPLAYVTAVGRLTPKPSFLNWAGLSPSHREFFRELYDIGPAAPR